MNQLFVSSKNITQNQLIITKDVFHHFSTVLKIGSGDMLALVLDQKEKWIVEVDSLTSDVLNFIYIKSYQYHDLGPKITLFQCLPKQDKFADILNGCTQLGLDEIIPVVSERTVTKIKKGNLESKLKRWRYILESASNQSQRFTIPTLLSVSKINRLFETIDFDQFDCLLFAWEEEKGLFLREVIDKLPHCDINSLKIGVLVGPEGGITQDEAAYLCKCGFRSFTLGPIILRVEIAAVSILSQLKYALQC